MNYKKVPLKTTFTIIMLSVITVVLLDQYTKHLVVQSIKLGEIVPVIEGFFNLTLTYNKGAAFGMFSTLADGTRQILLTSVTVISILAIFYFLFREYYHDRFAQFGLGLILGGAAGNVIDRAILGQVVDFLDLFYQGYHWPAFNIADSAICIGVAILIVRSPAQDEAPEPDLKA